MGTPPLTLSGLVLAIAFLYASIGSGGASGYLAAFSLFNLPPDVMSSTSLLLNVVVAGSAMLVYHRHGYYRPRLIWPFLAGSLPAAWIGGRIVVPAPVYHLLLAMVLLYAAVRLLLQTAPKAPSPDAHPPAWPLGLLLGAGIGLVSGIVGMGGGVFLAPLIVLANWGNSKHAASASSIFVVGTSLSGLVGRAVRHAVTFNAWTATLLGIGLLGALTGSLIGARRLSPATVQRLLGTVLLIVAMRILRLR